ncbi:MAG: hypothetical protein ABEJ83_00375 [Candidatus Nanohaloarchaea archaeon]
MSITERVQRARESIDTALSRRYATVESQQFVKTDKVPGDIAETLEDLEDVRLELMEHGEVRRGLTGERAVEELNAYIEDLMEEEGSSEVNMNYQHYEGKVSGYSFQIGTFSDSRSAEIRWSFSQPRENAAAPTSAST